MKLIYKFVFIGLVSFGIVYAKNGLHQKHLLGISPKHTEVTAKSHFVFTFDLPILKPSINRYTVILKQKNPHREKIPTQFTISDKHLVISPQILLDKGAYMLKVKPLSLTKKGDYNTLQIKTAWQKFVAWLCRLFYKDISKCSLCKFFCYTSHSIKTKPISFKFKIQEAMPKVTSIESNTSFIELSEYNSTAIKVIVHYDDNTSEDVTHKASYASSDSSVDADNGIITTNAEGSADITVSYRGKSAVIHVEVYEMVDGHLLPHAPQDPDGTLLGVDANHNGVRDDVERWIYKEMPTYHHPEIERVVAMTQAKAYQIALVDPTNAKDNTYKAIHRSIDCWFYYSQSKNLPFDGAVEKFGNLLRDKVYNTKERLNTYFKYDRTLAGRVFTSTPARLLNSSYCDQNIDILP